MSICNRCNKESSGMICYSFGYDRLCMECHQELVNKQDMKSLEQLEDCPLQLISQHDKKIVEDVIDKIKWAISDADKYICVKGKDIFDYLDEVQREYTEK